MMWALNIQSAINEMGGVSCGLIYFTGTHFTVPVTLTREKTPHLEKRIQQKVERLKQPGYTYSINYITFKN
jgi:hypothetical protein